jgi:glycerol-3-phosphate O-acyltransferase
VLVAIEPAAVIAEAVKLGFGARVTHPLGDIIKVPDDAVATLNYLRNNVLHAYALPALIASLLAGTREVTMDGVGAFAETAQPFLRAELMLHHSAVEAAGAAKAIVELYVELGFARAGSNASVRAGDRFSPEHAGLELLARSLRHLLRRNYLTIALLNQFGAASCSATPRGADAMLHAAALAAVRVCAARLLRAIDLRVVHRQR